MARARCAAVTSSALAAASVLVLAIALHFGCGDAGEVSPEAQWLRSNAVPLSTTDPSASLDDLEPLRGMVGDARVVALGEATHGTREFFRMKHRILRFLVERMGFDAFAIEATWPESNRVDRYVRTGQGDPEVLVSGLYFWTWQTSEVIDMVRWMRSHDAAGGHLGFHGFDMQYPGMAIDNVLRFVSAADPRESGAFEQHLACLATYGNDASGRFPNGYYGYSDQQQAYRDACLADLQWAADTLLERRDSYVAETSEADWVRAAQSARVAIQYEQMASNRVSRDAAMAENASWLLEQLGPRGKMVVWAHNMHLADYGGAMGQLLRQQLGSQLVVVGFDFARGSFSAGHTTGSMFAVGPVAADEPMASSYEEYFSSAEMPQFLLDLRRDVQHSPGAWLAGPRPFRSIGAVYDPSSPGDYWMRETQLPRLFDAVLFVEASSPSTLLPFRFPETFE